MASPPRRPPTRPTAPPASSASGRTPPTTGLLRISPKVLPIWLTRSVDMCSTTRSRQSGTGLAAHGVYTTVRTTGRCYYGSLRAATAPT
ncbi:MAG: hypothetical protein RM049_26615 [Nostoc sp. DedQUE04]|nr:hypothetical protein [Nostoc sp. DedQUE04]MDZ8138833.1 hypothetical protein [Nostoc sp. DedQUE04]